MAGRYRVLLGVMGWLLAFCGVLPPAQAQAQEATMAAGAGSLAGAVRGPDGAYLPGVTIVAAGATDDRAVRVVTGEHGGYRVSDLPAGRYDVRAELAGFQTATARGIDVAAGEPTIVDLQLTMEALKESVTVIGTAPRDSLEAPRIAECGARDVGEALTGVAGVWKVRKAGIANDVVLRGYQGDNLSMLIDGMRLYGACPGHMDRTAFHLDFAEVDRIEIGKGPFDMRNQGGLGGTVNIITKRPAAGLHVLPRVTFGSYGYINPSVTASVGSSRVAVLGGYSYRSSNAYTDGSGRSLIAVSNFKPSASDTKAFDINTGWGRVDASPAAGHAAQVSYTAQRAGAILYPYLQMDALYDNADRVNAEYSVAHGMGPVQGLRVQAYYSRVRHWMTDEFRTSSANMARSYSMGTMADTGTRGGKAEASWADGMAGIEIYRRTWGTETMTAMMKYQSQFPVPNVGITSAGVYAEHSLHVSDAWTIDLGGRLDRTTSAADTAKANTDLYFAYQNTRVTSAADTAPSGKVRATWRASSYVTVSGGVGHTVRVPDPQERYFAQKKSGGDWVGNPTLDPTGNTGLDLAVTFRHPRLYLTTTAYRDALTNFVTVYQQARVNMVPGVMSTSARSYGGVDATMTGLEIEGLAPLSDRVFVAGDVSAVRGTQVANPAAGIRSTSIEEIPPVRTRLALRYDARREKGGLFAEVEGVYSATQARVNSDVLEVPTPGYGIANLRGGASFGRVELTVGVGNLFDRTYTEHLSYQRDPYRLGVKVYEPGRNIYGQIAVRYLSGRPAGSVPTRRRVPTPGAHFG